MEVNRNVTLPFLILPLGNTHVRTLNISLLSLLLQTRLDDASRRSHQIIDLKNGSVTAPTDDEGGRIVSFC